MENSPINWTICTQCKGEGKKRRKISKKARLQYQKALAKSVSESTLIPPITPKASYTKCINCSGSGLVTTTNLPEKPLENYPHIAIIGGGIGGVALAVACLHRQIPFTLYERDSSFDARAQGYGLTLQQASKAIQALGILKLKEGVVSTKHIIHTTQGKIIGEWGMRKWLDSTNNFNNKISENKPDNNAENKSSKRTNIHIARQSLRFELLEQLINKDQVKWGYQLIDFKENKKIAIKNDQKVEKTAEKVQLTFQVNGKIKTAQADIVVGADGIRSSVRTLLLKDKNPPLRYLGCIVILGICPLDALKGLENPLLDSATVFQTANGNERIYMMPYSADSVMWQLSFPMPEQDAKILSKKGAEALKEEACRRTVWHEPIPQILAATLADKISGYPVYDRELLSSEALDKSEKITLIGDAAHPMSPFKGQGANQALLDALSLARTIKKECGRLPDWRTQGIRKRVLTDFEAEMLARSASKVKGSAAAVKFLHSDVVLQEGNEPRGRDLNR
ncbi:FAD-dependent monooxygenase [Tenacibaculum finnmarkense genomovar ulcerans]|uniref:FAD-dependent monooxygenase n=1 Tax=Tenacibaculum finnmarkense TaxID=2781243 RepID=UPI001E48C44E|nr:NAD(P)/FAD-dependent oxidoreductase [Tenacibaculum finnmarkense]MCD8432378.1 FAD-dependent monooxygenase [Tenacibaculum finnmarkense genomovar ulcerans]